MSGYSGQGLKEGLICIRLEQTDGPNGYITMSPSPSMRERELRKSLEDRSLGKSGRRTITLLAICCLASVFYVSVSIVPGLQPLIELRMPGFNGRSSEDKNINNVAFQPPHQTRFHFQSVESWMNGPVFYKGWYHLFYQYNPHGAPLANVSWGHAVSTDLVQWLYLETALDCKQQNGLEGLHSSSVTVLPDGSPAIIFRALTNTSEEKHSLAVPADASDPLLLKWVGFSEVRHPPRINSTQCQAPTILKEEDGSWRVIVGAKLGTSSGIEVANVLQTAPNNGNWDFVDLFPIACLEQNRSDSKVHKPSVKHVLMLSLNDDGREYLALGIYNQSTEMFIPDPPALGAALELRYDYGSFKASMTLFDPVKQRRILWGWVAESSTNRQGDIANGMSTSSLQAIPRAIWLDSKTGSNLLQLPVEEVSTLRSCRVSRGALKLDAGAVVEVDGATGGQLDVEVTFEYPNVSNVQLDNASLSGEQFECSRGATHRGTFGPFGLLLLADEGQQEQTSVFFYVFRSEDGQWSTKFCSDLSRSSLLPNIERTVYGSSLIVLPDENFLSLRVLVDHSIVESFVQGGRLAVTSRVYPKVALENRAHLFLFNNATTPITVRNLDAWQMNKASMYTRI